MKKIKITNIYKKRKSVTFTKVIKQELWSFYIIQNKKWVFEHFQLFDFRNFHKIDFSKFSKVLFFELL